MSDLTEADVYWRACYVLANERATRWQHRYDNLRHRLRTLAETWDEDALGNDRYCARELLAALEEDS